jgi:hypothetical protein
MYTKSQQQQQQQQPIGHTTAATPGKHHLKHCPTHLDCALPVPG